MKICYVLIKSDLITKYFIKFNFKLDDIKFISKEDLIDINENLNDELVNNTEILKYIKISYNYCIKNNFDFCIFNSGNGFFFDILKVKNFLNEFSKSKKLFSFRISKANGIYWNQEPKLPFIDNHFITMNIKEIQKSNFFSKKLINHSYSKGSFIENSLLSSFIEYSLHRDQISNHYYPNQLYNEYGSINVLNPLDYQVCEITSFVTYYREIKNNDFIFYKNLKNNSQNNKPNNDTNLSCYVYKKKLNYFKFINFVRGLISPKYKELNHNEKRIKK